MFQRSSAPLLLRILAGGRRMRLGYWWQRKGRFSNQTEKSFSTISRTTNKSGSKWRRRIGLPANSGKPHEESQQKKRRKRRNFKKLSNKLEKQRRQLKEMKLRKTSKCVQKLHRATQTLKFLYSVISTPFHPLLIFWTVSHPRHNTQAIGKVFT